MAFTKYCFVGFLFLTALLIPVQVKAQGKVGINTSTPLAGLHVMDSSVLFSGMFSSTAPGDPPVSGPGTRMMWYPGKAAFRVGRAFGTHWDRDSIGNYSVAIGSNTKALGTYAFAGGTNSTARGTASIAFGQSTTASGHLSVALGLYSRASNYYAFAAGDSSQATGNASTAFGTHSIASGSEALAVGFEAIASGNNAIAFGAFSVASGNTAFTHGWGTRAAGSYSTAFGNNTRANGYSSLVAGRYNDTIVAPQSIPVAETPLFIIGNGTSNANRSNAMVVRNDGRVGLGISNPSRRLHIYQGAGGGLYNNNAMMILEDNTNFYIQLSVPTTFESGILFGNASSSIRSGLVFGPDGQLDLRAGGNSTKARVETNGDFNVFDGEIKRTATGEANLLPICYGTVNSSGNINSGSGNFTVTNPSTGRYDVVIDDTDYSSSAFTTCAVAISSSARIVSCSSSSGALLIRIFDAAGTLIDNGFHFVVYNE